MDLQQALSMVKFKERGRESPKKKVVNAHVLAKSRVLLAEREGRRDYEGYSVEDIADRLFASTTFTLMELSINKIASPGPRFANHLVRRIMAEGPRNEAVVVDANVHKVGRASKTGYYPSVIVVEGKERFEAAMNNGEEKILAWVGNLAAERLDIQADHQIGTEELQSMLYEAIKEDLGLTNQTRYDSDIYIQNVYPLENYCIYKYKGASWRQKYIVDMDERSVTLVGPPKGVTQKWQDTEVKVKAGTMASAIQACACQTTQANSTEFFARKDGKPIPLKSCMESYASAIRAGRITNHRTLQAKSPPGWKNTVEKMKDHPDIDNPWALAHWMNDQGYEPRYKEK